MNSIGVPVTLLIGLLGLGFCSNNESRINRDVEARAEFPAECMPRNGNGFVDGKLVIESPGGGGRDYLAHTACWWRPSDDEYHTAHIDLIETVGYYSLTIAPDDTPAVHLEIERLPFDGEAVARRVLSLAMETPEIEVERVPAARVAAGAEDCWRYRSRYSQQSVAAYPGVVFEVRASGLYCVAWDPTQRVENRAAFELSEQFAPELGHTPIDAFETIADQLLSTLKFGRGANSESRPLALEIRFQYEAALAAEVAGESDEAFERYTKAIALSDGAHPGAFHNRALINASRGDLEAAFKDIEMALQLDSRNGLYHANKCMILRLQGKAEEALEACDMALTSDMPDSNENRAWVYLQRALVLFVLGEMEAAETEILLSLDYAKPSTLSRIQEILKAEALYDGPSDGTLNPELKTAISSCIHSETCFDRASAQMRALVDFLE